MEATKEEVRRATVGDLARELGISEQACTLYAADQVRERKWSGTFVRGTELTKQAEDGIRAAVAADRRQQYGTARGIARA